MIRRFKFEDELHRTLECVPMPVRRKLDRIGLKVGLEQWRALSNGERLAICHLPADNAEECAAMTEFIHETVERRCGTAPKTLAPESRAIAEPPGSPPTELIAHARAAGFTLDADAWARLDSDQRYALVKLGATAAPSHNLPAALEEFLHPR